MLSSLARLLPLATTVERLVRQLGRIERGNQFMLAAAVIAVATPGAAAAIMERPLMRDFVGVNAYAAGHGPGRGFDPDLYAPVCRLVREYHSVKRDLADDPSVAPPWPRAKDGTDWSAVYEAWIQRGWRIDASLQFEMVAREKWRDLEAEARAYGRAYAREFGPSGARKLVESVEIGNEPPWNDEDFSRIFSAMAQGLREGDPKLRIVTSNVTVGPSGRWDKSIDCVAPHRASFDVLGVHVYPEIAQEPTWQRSYPENPKLLRYLNDVDALCRWRDQHAPEKEVWITEFGYDSSTKPAMPDGKFPQWIGITDTQQAQWLVRSILMFAAMPVNRAYIYFFNDRDIPSLHQSAGLTRNFQPKPSFHALAHLQRVLGDCRFTRVVTDEPGALRVHEFRHESAATKRVLVVWSPTGADVASRRVLPNVGGRLVRAERMPLSAANEAPIDEAPAVQRADGSIEVEVTESPVYLVLEDTPSAARTITASELNRWLRSLQSVPEPSVDRVIAGDPSTPVRGIAVVWMPTWAALREAEVRGCNVVVAHEPTFFSHHDLDGFEPANGSISPAARAAMIPTRDAKLRWIQDHGMVVIRCHDVLDLLAGGVVDSMIRELGFQDADVLVREPYYRVVKIEPAKRAAELGQALAKRFARLGQPGVAFYGDPDRLVRRLGLGTGYACEPWRFVELGADMGVSIDDRIKTWIESEWADDSGFPMVVIHHGTSEESGVRRLKEIIAQAYPGTPVHLIPQGFRARWLTGR